MRGGRWLWEGRSEREVSEGDGVRGERRAKRERETYKLSEDQMSCPDWAEGGERRKGRNLELS